MLVVLEEPPKGDYKSKEERKATTESMATWKITEILAEVLATHGGDLHENDRGDLL